MRIRNYFLAGRELHVKNRSAGNYELSNEDFLLIIAIVLTSYEAERKLLQFDFSFPWRS
jgi:hypothetical protein